MTSTKSQRTMPRGGQPERSLVSSENEAIVSSFGISNLLFLRRGATHKREYANHEQRGCKEQQRDEDGVLPQEVPFSL